MATTNIDSPQKDYDIILITPEGITYYKEKGFYGLDGLKK